MFVSFKQTLLYIRFCVTFLKENNINYIIIKIPYEDTVILSLIYTETIIVYTSTYALYMVPPTN
jgi:hypothetical protein